MHSILLPNLKIKLSVNTVSSLDLTINNTNINVNRGIIGMSCSVNTAVADTTVFISKTVKTAGSLVCTVANTGIANYNGDIQIGIILADISA